MKNLLQSKIAYLLVFCGLCSCAQAQKIKQKQVKIIISNLAADDMMGRKAGTKGEKKAAAFIAQEFTKAGVKPLPGFKNYYQKFTHQGLNMLNVLGVIPGKSKNKKTREEIVVFSAHYDHLGVRKGAKEDSIYNGADDDASGVTAVISLAHYFNKQGNNQRTLMFVAFTAEEIGLVGSTYFGKQLKKSQLAKIVAGINIEMVGKASKFGRKGAFITGYSYSNLGKILQENAQGTGFTFHPDPYKKYNLFQRSDNYALARHGIPAHTISSVDIANDKHYHQVSDEVDTLDIENLTDMIKAVALGVRSIVAGKDTPTRLKMK
ncbi:M20/M25/M40 family metallo-hydrolase [Microscilla marina]|uniref:Aminopeptidase n=1 Tax=Microscilla marina ATCC 23134 TaxID=313606 RepID=A1ZKJ1_MICM2|nr:M20/M25/M40 family metallo-hydrolase [Microscilla marina]EAY29217.1 aminopeptidase [Microscilla marina ATCC 23134]